jgi:DNA-binding CsgD family transcriptional regulator
MIGVKPGELNPYHFFVARHAGNINHHGKGRSKMFSLANDLYAAEQGRSLLSANIRLRNLYGDYHDLLFQLSFFFSRIPCKSVYLLQIHTGIEDYQKRKYGHHYYVVNDFGNFRYPDEELLNLGYPFTDREFEAIQLIEAGLQREQSVEKLFLRIYTDGSHLKNILSEPGMKQMPDLVEDLLTRRMP